jgi:hypothetical protein
MFLIRAFSFATGRRISIRRLLRRTLVRSVILLDFFHAKAQRRKEHEAIISNSFLLTAACLHLRSLLLVILAKEVSVNEQKGKDCNQYHCSYLPFITPPTDPSFLGMTKPPHCFIANKLITIRLGIAGEGSAPASPLRGLGSPLSNLLERGRG